MCILIISTPTVRSRWNKWVVMAACHGFWWWRWWGLTLWAPLLRLGLHLLSCYLQSGVVEISLQYSSRYIICIVQQKIVCPDVCEEKKQSGSFHPVMCIFQSVLKCWKRNPHTSPQCLEVLWEFEPYSVFNPRKYRQKHCGNNICYFLFANCPFMAQQFWSFMLFHLENLYLSICIFFPSLQRRILIYKNRFQWL